MSPDEPVPVDIAKAIIEGETAPLAKDITHTPSLSVVDHLMSRNIDFHCGLHGDFDVTVWRIGGEWSAPRCPKCEEEKRIKEEHEQQRHAAAKLQQQARERMENTLKRASIPPRFAQKGFREFETNNNEATLKVLHNCLHYAEDFKRHRADGSGMILCGNPGTGKTHLACAIANFVVRSHKMTALYVTAGRAFRTVKDTFNHNSTQTYEQAVRAFSQPDLLVMDEIGVQYGSETERTILFEIVNDRYENCLPTILISNLNLPSMADFAGERVIDRMKENGGRLLAFDWKSYRGSVKNA